MTRWTNEWQTLAACALLGTGALATGPARADWPPPSFDAVYEILMDGKPRMATRVRFERTDGTWRLSNSGEGTKGLARFLRAATTDTASGTWDGDILLPDAFRHESRVAGRHDTWTARFDWSSQRVFTVHEEGESELPLERGTVDPLGLTLALQSQLDQGLEEWELSVAEEDEIDRHRYRAGPPQPLQTALGCLEAVEVERVREDSPRYSSAWYAPDLSFITVRMVHGKRGSREFEMRIQSLTLDGEAVEPGADCPGTD